MLAGDKRKRRLLQLDVEGSFTREERSKLRQKDGIEVSQEEGIEQEARTLAHSKEYKPPCSLTANLLKILSRMFPPSAALGHSVPDLGEVDGLRRL